MELFKPRGAALRKPTDNKQEFGTVINTPRYSEIGGLSNSGKIAASKMGAVVKKPTDGKKVI